MKNPKHIIIQKPELQAQLLVHSDGPYSIVHMGNNEQYYYVVGNDSINCISGPQDQIRMIWTKNIADIIANELNVRFPTQKPVEPEKPIDMSEKV